jgi:hypothetical protein
VYDGTTVAALTGSVTGVIGADDVGLIAAGAFADKNAGTDKLVNVSGSLSGADAANYVLTSNTTTTADIAQRAIVGSITASDKVYDGTTTAALSGALTGAIASDDVTMNATGAFADKNAGTGKQVNVSGSLSGADAANYLLTSNTSTTADIAQRAIVGSIAASDKVYDGTTIAALSGSLTGVIGGDDVDFVATGAFADKHAGTDKLVNVSGALSGSDAANYSLSTNVTTAADITPRSLSLTATADRRSYDGTATSTASVGVHGLVGGDAVSSLSQSFDSSLAGPRTLAVNAGYVIDDGNGGGNYRVTAHTAAGVIDRAPLTLMPRELRALYGVPITFQGSEFEIASGRLFGADRIDSVRLSSDGATPFAAPGRYAIQIGDARGVGLENYSIGYSPAAAWLHVLGAAGSVDGLGDTLTTLHERREELDLPKESTPLIAVVEGGMRLPEELSGTEARP